MIRKQPELEIKPTSIDKKIILFGWIIVFCHFIFVFIFYADLPDEIPTHFNLKGQADSFGNKSTLWILPILNALLYFGMCSVATKVKPQLMNYPIRVTDKNAPYLYAKSIRLLVTLNVVIGLLLFSISFDVVMASKKAFVFELSWVTMILLLLTITIPFYHIYQMFKLPKD